MRVIKPNVEILTHINGEEILKHIERCARTCYKSENKITDDSAKMIKSLLTMNHESTIEHYNITVKFITDRGVSHEIVRHRLACVIRKKVHDIAIIAMTNLISQLTFILPC